MRPGKQHRLWTVGVVSLALFSFLAGTSLACLQREVGSIKIAKDCCQHHCQHVMAADMAAQCCQNHQTAVSQVLPVVSSAKAVVLAASLMHIALLPPAALQGREQAQVRFRTGERPPPSRAFYSLHCALLI